MRKRTLKEAKGGWWLVRDIERPIYCSDKYNLFTYTYTTVTCFFLSFLFFFRAFVAFFWRGNQRRCSTEHLTASYPGSARNSAAGSLASSRESSASQGPTPYRVLMLGAPAVGKSSLVSQFMTSEYLHAYDTSIGKPSTTPVSLF